MSEQRRSDELREKLIAQDPGITESQLREFRMNLEQSLESLERRAQSSKRLTIRAVIAVILCYMAAFVLNAVQPQPPYLQIVGVIWSLVTLIAMITAGVSLARYWYKHRPSLERGRTDLQIAMFAELQRQIHQLTQRLEDRTNP